MFGYVMCTIQSNSVSTSSEGLRRLRIVTIPFSLLIMLVGQHYSEKVAIHETLSEVIPQMRTPL